MGDDGVKVAFVRFVLTEPVALLQPLLSLKVSGVRVEPSIYVEKVAVTAVFVPTPVAPLEGFVEVIETYVVPPPPPPPEATGADMVKELLTAGVNTPLVAVRLFEPARLMLKSLNVARPLAFVAFGVVPLSTPVPEDNDIAIETSAAVTLFPSASCNCTVTAGLIADPVVASEGC